MLSCLELLPVIRHEPYNLNNKHCELDYRKIGGMDDLALQFFWTCLFSFVAKVFGTHSG